MVQLARDWRNADLLQQHAAPAESSQSQMNVHRLLALLKSECTQSQVML